MNTKLTTHPILSDHDAAELEARLFSRANEDAWRAMRIAGDGIARQLTQDLKLLRPSSPTAPLQALVLLGKGHNAGDALLAMRSLHLSGVPLRARAIFAMGRDGLRPLLQRAIDETVSAGLPLEMLDWKDDPALFNRKQWDFSIDGIFGLSFRPPLFPAAASLIRAINAFENISLRAAVDYPSGLNEATAASSQSLVLRSDFTYQTGSPKQVLFAPELMSQVGRLRYVDIGLFKNNSFPDCKRRMIVRQSALRALSLLRAPDTDKRYYGHCFVLSGSSQFAGAHLMNVQGALVAGPGLVSAFAPPAFASAFCARVPSAIWHCYPANLEGGPSTEGADSFLEKALNANALLIGSGIGRSKDTQTLIRQIVSQASCPIVIDADGLTEALLEVIAARPADAGACLLTPHAGEYLRLNPDGKYGTEADFCRKFRVILVRKGPRTTVFDAENAFLNVRASPALARGGSGDVLAGMMAGLLAQTPKDPLHAALCAVLWHGVASENAERLIGQRCATTEHLIESLPNVLLSEENNCEYQNII